MKLHAIFVSVAVCFAIIGEAAVTTTKKMTTKKITTTKKTTTPAPANQSYKVCSDTNSTSASGSVQPLGGLTPNTTARTCNFNINAPVGQQVQLTCWAVSLSTLNLSQAGFSPVVINSLTFNNVIDIFQTGDYIVPNRVYTSKKNTFSMTYRVVNAKDFFNCSWTTITAPASTATNFKWCRDEQASAGNGAISTIQEINTNDDWYRVCPFFINSTAGRLTQMSCSAVSAKSLLPLTTFEGAFVMSFMTWLPYVNRLTASGSRADLLVRYYKTDQLNCQWKSITPSSTTTSDANLCLRGPSTNSNGTIQQLSNLPLSAGQTKWCLFSIIVPADKKVQVSCSVVNLVSEYSYLMFDGVTEVPTPSTGLLPTLNRIYTSIKNRIDVATSYMNGDEFTCKWNTVTISATTPFTLCIQGETTVAGSIKSNAVATAFSRACRFNIKAPSSKRVKINCPTVNSPDNMLLQYDAFGNNNTLASPMVAQTSYTSNSNEIVLFAVLNSVMLNCTWTFV
ncbi:uncharacterized protein LOC124343647 isoform X2 [Daphnia pulicaria]|uniref:uncharacterized protein LOC124313007 isoform X2 n=1 Tax=Daphnia pulicaria TaxID=35523 RepID=UPI001EE9ECA1|nr:uncharacterized protein LOC124313007 isoform X2 [Daphnia pulicaria]XP_046653017.1 uncharacterized protein LOC124343647 isoform X2 [Daphnia pulicaria]